MEVHEAEIDFKYIVVIREFITGMTILHPIMAKTPENVLQGLLKYVSCFGEMRTLIHDGGSEFKGAMTSFCSTRGILREITTSKISHENGYAESAIAIAKKNIRLVRLQHSEMSFECQVQMANMWINNNPKYNTGYTPIELMTMISTVLDSKYCGMPIDQNVRQSTIKHLNVSKAVQQDKLNKSLRKVELGVGDRVWYYNPNTKLKLTEIATMATIIEMVRDKQFRIQEDDEERSRVAHADSLVKIEEIQGECSDLEMKEVNHCNLSNEMTQNDDLENKWQDKDVWITWIDDWNHQICQSDPCKDKNEKEN
eukprot:NODE_117_length_18329_cov_0.420954.p6 type:complete len:311 gc:universal NODE_117_length_18329_cov_0.420954:15286-14354(-)